MITCNLIGGLGNQLFMIFNLISYSLTYNKEFCFENINTPSKKRPYYWDNLLINLKKFIKIPQRKCYKYYEPYFYYSKIPENISNKNKIKFFGYYQSFKYFEKNYDEIVELICLKDQQKKIKKKYLNIYKFDNLVSIHFRIGDFKTKSYKKTHPILPIKYYIDSLNKIINELKLSTFNVLCFFEEEDLEIVNQNIEKLKNTFKNLNFIKINTKIKDYEQLLLISLCNHNIIANSTFSWWGAYLNSNKKKIVICPNLWFSGIIDIKYEDLYPTNWIKI